MNIKIMDVDGFLDDYLGYCNLFNNFPNKKITDKYVKDNSLESFSSAYWLEVIGYGVTEETYRCSSCEREVHKNTPYCPYCGAFMKASEYKTMPRGRWKRISQGYEHFQGKSYPFNEYSCTECGHIIKTEKNDVPKYSICPNCGVKMYKGV